MPYNIFKLFVFIAFTTCLIVGVVSERAVAQSAPQSVPVARLQSDQPPVSPPVTKNVTPVLPITTRGAAVVAPPTAGGSVPPVMINQNGAGPRDKEDMIASNLYAQHLFVSICTQNQQYTFPLYKMAADKKAQFFQIAQAACTCMSNKIMESVSAADLSDYVMYRYGKKQDADNFSPEAKAFMATPVYLQIGSIEEDPAVAKKCGFTN